jgi:hypothetical protein
MTMIKKGAFAAALILIIVMAACATQKGIDPATLTSPDRKALYDLMARRCQAVNTRDINTLETIYVKNAHELLWIQEKGMPTWEKYGVTLGISDIRKMTIIGTDAAVNFILTVSNTYGSYYSKNVEVLYRKEGSEWKIESVGDR